MAKFQIVTEDDLLKARLFNQCYLSEDGCWKWKKITRRGYGLISHKGVYQSAHRLSYTIFKGAINKGLVVRHTCDQPACVNPDHLILGTMKDNAVDRETRGRGRSLYGEASATAKLSPLQAIFIKITDIPLGALSKAFGATEAQISRIRLGKSWAHLNAAALWARLNASASIEGVICGN